MHKAEAAISSRAKKCSWSSTIIPLTSEQVQAEFTWNLLFLRMGAFAIGLKCTLTSRDRQAPDGGGGRSTKRGKEYSTFESNTIHDRASYTQAGEGRAETDQRQLLLLLLLVRWGVMACSVHTATAWTAPV